jgi:predicted secreted protein
MSPWSGLAIYFIIWWLTLFVILPFGVRNASEAGQTVDPGHDPGAPVNPQLGRKLLATTAVSAVIFGLFFWARSSGLLLF